MINDILWWMLNLGYEDLIGRQMLKTAGAHEAGYLALTQKRLQDFIAQ